MHKPRAWHIKEKRMFEVVGWDNSGDTETIKVIVPGRMLLSHPPQPMIRILEVGKEVILMQSKNKKDVTGADIFDGDIVEVTIPETHTSTGEEGTMTIVVDNSDRWYWYRYCDMKILGSTHENPELLD